MIPGILAATGRYLNLAALSNCALWLDASDASTITHSGGAVSQINDKSGNGRHFTQGTSANQPRIDTHTQNGLAVLDFDGVNDRLERGASGLGRNVAGITIYAVAKADSSASNRTIWQCSKDSTATRATIHVGQTASKLGIGGRRLDSEGYQGLTGSGGANIPSGFGLFTGVLDYANSDAYAYIGQSLDQSTTAFQTNGNSSNTDAATSTFGTSITATQFWDGQIGEVIVFHEAHSSDTMALIWAYLNRKWGLS